MPNHEKEGEGRKELKNHLHQKINVLSRRWKLFYYNEKKRDKLNNPFAEKMWTEDPPSNIQKGGRGKDETLQVSE